MVGGGTAGKTAVVFFGVHRFHSLAVFFRKGLVRQDLSAIEPRNPLCFWENRTMLGKRIKACFFCHSKKDELTSKDH